MATGSQRTLIRLDDTDLAADGLDTIFQKGAHRPCPICRAEAVKDLDWEDRGRPDRSEDVRGRKVVDRDGEEVGDVDSLLLDDEERRVRFLEIGSGGFLGIGKKKRLVPVDAVTRVDDETVHIDTTRSHVATSSGSHPDLTTDTDYYGGLYSHYGYTPYWVPGYVYPPYPH